MRRVRVIPVLLLRDRGMVKTRAFAKPQYMGDPINAVKIFNEKQADELVLLDIEAGQKGRIEFDWIEDIISEAFMPIAYGGGIQTIEQAAELFSRGVEKIVLNTSVVKRPELICEISERFGAQAVIVAIDARKNLFNRFKAYVRNARSQTRYTPSELAGVCEDLGAGEILLTNVEREGAFKGYDIELLDEVCGVVNVPVIANGGAGSMDHFQLAVEAGASAVAAGSMFIFAGKDQGMLINYPGQNELKDQFWKRI